MIEGGCPKTSTPSLANRTPPNRCPNGDTSNLSASGCFVTFSFLGGNGADASSPCALEVLHRALVVLRRCARRESAQVSAAAVARILLPRIQTILARFKFA